MIIFYHEMEGTSSGAAILIMNLIRGLVSKGHQVVLINFKNGAMHQQLSDIEESLFSVIDKNKESIKRFAANVSRDDIIITTHFYSIFRLFKKANPKILFYCVGHIQLFEANRFFKKINFLFLTRRLVNLLKSKNGVLFIEQNALKQSIKMLSLDPDGFPMLPIPIMTPDKNLYLEKKKSEGKDAIVFTYVGRAVDFKIYPVKKMIYDILVPGLKKKVILQIVTDDADAFRKALANYRGSNVEVLFHENFSQQELDDFLLKNSDVHFAMGTSALEGAKLGVPTILIDYSFKEFPQKYRYKFVYQSAPTYIGSDIGNETEFDGMMMNEVLDVTNDLPKLEKVSEACYNYIIQNHDLRNIMEKMQCNISDCKSDIRTISKYLIRYWK